LRVYINRLRHKLEPDPANPRYLLTEPGVGYRFVAPESEGARRRPPPVRNNAE
jgi:two-component system KDP operon response regulator KdpE